MQNTEFIKDFLEEKKDEFLLTNEVAKILKKSSKMIIYLANHNKLNNIKTNSGVRLFLRSEIQKLLVA